MKTIIKKGTIVNTDAQLRADILIENGIISKIATTLNDAADRLIDASDCYIFPGGIDPHVHMHLPNISGFSADDFYSGSRAALMGGTTTLIDFVTPMRGQSLTQALEVRRQEAANALTDVYFHVSPVEFSTETERELRECLNSGIRSFKVYMAYKNNIGLQDDELQKVLKIVGSGGGIVAVHCEMGDEIEAVRDQFFRDGKTTPLYHALSRPPETEAQAVKKVIEMARLADCPLYLVHISAAASLAYIKAAQQAGQLVYAETCPQYLLLDESKYRGTFEKTAAFVLSPPLRTAADRQALWDAISEGVIQSVGTDHCPFMLSQKKAGLNDFRKIPNGAGGVEHRLALLYTYGVLENKISLSQFVNLTSTMPAKIFGLYPRKGIIKEGADADIVVWNPTNRDVISAKTHHSKSDLSIYEGLATRGKPEFVLKAGKVVML
jgi:dihydropyrimidinase